ncbi:hypothetical protein AB6809_29335 [Paraburkholderia sp. RCC_158]|uniref:hypothetical protein n=1 Tax=Paraburkholderia sp. RCC_158 TaxID=3239220 RepID=UPI0035252DC0
MKIKLVQKGWESYTGNFGGVNFAAGESVSDVAESDARRLANIVRIDRLDGTNPSSSQVALDSKCISMSVLGTDPTTGTPKPVLQFSVEQLEHIAGEKGIKGLREIGDVYGVKATGIAELIKLILNAQAAKAAGDVPAEEVKTAVPVVEPVVEAAVEPVVDAPVAETAEAPVAAPAAE